MTATHRAFLGLGSNLGDRVALLRDAIAALPDVDALSAVYETAPVGGPDQDPFLNVVVRLQTALDARELLELGQARERAAARERIVRWGPRTLDGEVVDDPDLVVPHPRMFERAFVLVPLADVGADLLPADYDVESAAKVEGVARVGLLDELDASPT